MKIRKAMILVNNKRVGLLIENSRSDYEIIYDENYSGPSISLTLPLSKRAYKFKHFPPFFEGLLPEGIQLEALLRQKKIDPHDYFTQLLAVGEDLVGNVTLRIET